MDDLHKPLGQNPKVANNRSWFGLACGTVAVCMASLLAYVFIDSRNSGSTVVALNGPVQSDSSKVISKNIETSESSNHPNTQPEEFDLSKVKPLSPIDPLPENSGSESIETPSFRRKNQPSRPVSNWLPMTDLVEKSEFGSLPKISDGGIRPLDAYAKSNGAAGANRIAIVLGGIGLSQTGSQSAINELPPSITLGFSPFGLSLQRWMQLARRQGHEVVLQLPMEPLGYPTIDPGPRTLTSLATPGENLMNLRWSLARMTNYPLVMNYLGSGLTSKPTILRPLLDEIRKRGLGYIDDGTATASVALDVAKSLRLPHTRANTVIDSNRKPEQIRANLLALETLAKAKGFAMGTATAFPETVAALKEWTQSAAKRGIVVVPASALLKDYSR